MGGDGGGGHGRAVRAREREGLGLGMEVDTTRSISKRGGEGDALRSHILLNIPLCVVCTVASDESACRSSERARNARSKERSTSK